MDNDIGVEAEALEGEADEGDCDMDEDPDDQDEMKFLVPGFSPIMILDTAQVTFDDGLIGKRVAYKFVRDCTVLGGWFVGTVTRKRSPESFQKKGFNYVMRFVKIGDFQLCYGGPEAKALRLTLWRVESGEWKVESGEWRVE
eukprot:304001-Rhodomonas_salina.2